MPISSACFRDCVVRSLRLLVSGIAWFAHFVCKFPGLRGSLTSSACFRDCVVRSLRLQVSGIAWFVCKFPGLRGSLISSACFRDCVVRSLRLQVSGIAWFAHFVCLFPGLRGSLTSSASFRDCVVRLQVSGIAWFAHFVSRSGCHEIKSCRSSIYATHMHTTISMLQLARHNSYIRSIILCFTTCVLQINDKNGSLLRVSMILVPGEKEHYRVKKKKYI